MALLAWYTTVETFYNIGSPKRKMCGTRSKGCHNIHCQRHFVDGSKLTFQHAPSSLWQLGNICPTGRSEDQTTDDHLHGLLYTDDKSSYPSLLFRQGIDQLKIFSKYNNFTINGKLQYVITSFLRCHHFKHYLATWDNQNLCFRLPYSQELRYFAC